MDDTRLTVKRAREALHEAGFSMQEINRLLAYREDLRDKFAMKAMEMYIIVDIRTNERSAKLCYEMADAMMEERIKREPKN